MMPNPNHYARLAQLDRALASEAKGHRFDSCTARHLNKASQDAPVEEYICKSMALLQLQMSI